MRPNPTQSQRNNPLYVRLLIWVTIISMDATSREWGPTSNGELIGGRRTLQPSTTTKPPFERGETASHGLKTLHLEKVTKTRQIIAWKSKSVNKDKNTPLPSHQDPSTGKMAAVTINTAQNINGVYTVFETRGNIPGPGRDGIHGIHII